jgi:hypothetical protein
VTVRAVEARVPVCGGVTPLGGKSFRDLQATLLLIQDKTAFGTAASVRHHEYRFGPASSATTTAPSAWIRVIEAWAKLITGAVAEGSTVVPMRSSTAGNVEPATA